MHKKKHVLSSEQDAGSLTGTMPLKRGLAVMLILLFLVALFTGCSLIFNAAPATAASPSGGNATTEAGAESTAPSVESTASQAESTASQAESTASPAESTAPPTESTVAETEAASESPTPKPERSGTKFPDFSMQDLDGNVFDQTIFAGSELTMVNMWGTFCPPCIAEMPDLGKLAKVLESDYNARLIGLVVDISSEDTLALAKDILGRSEAAHLNLIPDEAVSKFLQQFEFVPTTFFIDKEGYILGQPVVGGHSYGDYLVLVKNLLGK
jgi:thiol-disulfide isomerase/thioredoxin